MDFDQTLKLKDPYKAIAREAHRSICGCDRFNCFPRGYIVAAIEQTIKAMAGTTVQKKARKKRTERYADELPERDFWEGDSPDF